MNFLTHLFLALGEGDRISPLGRSVDAERYLFRSSVSILLYLRASNREAPRFHLAAAEAYIVRDESVA